MARLSMGMTTAVVVAATSSPAKPRVSGFEKLLREKTRLAAATTPQETAPTRPGATLCKACHRDTPEEYREPVPGGYFCRNCVEDWAEDGE
jgi:hypothetical protein